MGHLKNKKAIDMHKAVYTATEVACGWAGAVIKNAFQAIGQGQ